MEFKDDFEFKFDQPLPEKPLVENERAADGVEELCHLTFPCPKCAAEIELDVSGEDQHILNVTCASCNSAVSIVRESCATRARRQPSEIICSRCGACLNHQPHCPSCGALFPDFYAAMSPEEASRKVKAKRSAELRRSLSKLNPSFYFDLFGFLGGRTERLPDVRPIPERHAAQKVAVSPRGLRLVITLLVVTLLAGGASYAFHLHQRQQVFVDNYFRAVNGIKAGNDFSLEVCSKMAADWKAATDSGLRFTPRLNDKEQARINTTNQNVDKLLQYMGTPPGKFAQAHQKLVQLKSAYQKSQSLVTTPPENLQSLTTSADQAASNFKTAAQDLKNNLPEAMKDQLDEAKLKYHGLRDL